MEKKKEKLRELFANFFNRSHFWTDPADNHQQAAAFWATDRFWGGRGWGGRWGGMGEGEGWVVGEGV